MDNKSQNKMTYEIGYYFLFGAIMTIALIMILLSLDIVSVSNSGNTVGSYYGDF